LPGDASYQTLAGFILFYLGRVPRAADHFEWNGLRFEITDMDGRRIDKVLVNQIDGPATAWNQTSIRN
jgi:putative hemolysin